MNQSLYAHSANDRGDRHDWAEHAEGTARLAASFAGAFGMEEWGRLLGLWHDIGKLADDWQRYLVANEAGRAPRGGPDHKAAGAQLGHVPASGVIERHPDQFFSAGSLQQHLLA